MEDPYLIQFDGLREEYLPSSECIILVRYSRATRVAGSRVLDVSEHQLPETKVTALTQLAKAYAHAVNSGVDPGLCKELISNAADDPDLAVEWEDLQGFEPVGLVQLVNPIPVYLLQHDDGQNWVVVSPNRFAEAMSKEELAEYLVDVKREQRYGGD